MKIWQGYGSEHSSNLVMIGHFKTAIDAKAAKEKFDRIVERLSGKIEFERTENRFSEVEIQELTRENIFLLTPNDIEQLVFEYDCSIDDNKICITSEELEITVFVKFLIENGARVEVYSAHYYPGSGLGR
jgi:hypothetical protein